VRYEDIYNRVQALAVKGAFWVVVGFGLSNVLRLGSNLVLTRILAPDIYGLMALANVFILGLTLVSEVGTQLSVVRSLRGEDENFLRTVWTIQVIRGVVIGIVAALLAWPASVFYDQPLLFPLICFTALGTVAKNFQSIRMATLNRDLSLWRITMLTLAAQLLSSLVTIGLALVLENVWALAIGTVASGVFLALLSHTTLPAFHHRFQMERETLNEVISLGRWVMLGTIFTFFGGQGGLMIQSALVPVEVVGLISIATLIGRLPAQLLQRTANTVLVPVFSKAQREKPERLMKGLRRVRFIIIAGVLPLMFGGALVAQPLIEFLYDPRYFAAGFVLALILCEDAIWLLTAPYQKLLLADGKTKLHSMVMLVWAASRTVGMLVGFQIAGLPGMFAGMVAGTSLMVAVSVGVAKRQGYATLWLDALCFAMTLSFFVYVLLTSEVPPELAF
jgi:O-antigen/teichoic acid export membrane protein